MAALNDDTVLQIVHQWPPQQRFALIRDLIDSLEPASAKAATLPRAVGLLATTQPPPMMKRSKLGSMSGVWRSTVHEPLDRYQCHS